jgi:ParB-like chromosome segregation protein Spo0J
MSEIVNQFVGVGNCYPHPDNYNRHPAHQVERLRESLRTFEQVRSIVVQDDGQGGFVLVAGEGIWTAAKIEGFETIRADVIPTDWPAVRVKAYVAADNELARLGDPDLAQLAALAEDVASVDEKLAALAAGTEERLKELTEMPNIIFPEYDESIADEVEWTECPKCGHKFPK